MCGFPVRLSIRDALNNVRELFKYLNATFLDLFEEFFTLQTLTLLTQ